MTVSLVDYGLGNLGSVVNMLKRVGVESRRVSTPDEVVESERLILPGVGAYDSGVAHLEKLGLTDAIRRFADTGRPLLGICLGMQLLVDSSAEGEMNGLGLIRGRCEKFADTPRLRVPHMSWNRISALREDPLLAELDEESRFYFVHSYHVITDSPANALAETQYGRPFVSMIRNDNVMGAQFHPEKSHKFGMILLKNFTQL